MYSTEHIEASTHYCNNYNNESALVLFVLQIPIAVSGIRGMGFLMKYHIETEGGNLPPKLANLFIKVSPGMCHLSFVLPELFCNDRNQWNVACIGVSCRGSLAS